MKKLIIPMLLLVTAFVSCSKHNEEKLIAVSDLPSSVTSYIANNYPAEYIYKAASVRDSHASYLVTLNSDEELSFDHDGGFLGEGKEDNHHGHHYEHHHPGEGHHHNGFDTDSLPASITDYISTNFADYTIHHAETDSICSDGVVTEVMIFKQGSEPLKLYFTTTGTFLMQGTRILSSDLPEAVKTTIASGFPGYSLRERSEKYVLADNYTVEYFIFLCQGEAHKEVIIKEDGTTLCNW
jgi:hypothetical protein